MVNQLMKCGSVDATGPFVCFCFTFVFFFELEMIELLKFER